MKRETGHYKTLGAADRVMDKWDIESQLRLTIVKKLRALGINVAAPTRLIRLEKVDKEV